MVTESPINDSEIEAGKPITQSLMTRLRDNPIARIENHKGVARATVNLDARGSMDIRKTHGVSGITKQVNGLYTITFENPFPDTNYTWVCNNFTFRDSNPNSYLGGIIATLPTSSSTYLKKTTTQFQFQTFGGNQGLATDDFDINIAFFE